LGEFERQVIQMVPDYRAGSISRPEPGRPEVGANHPAKSRHRKSRGFLWAGCPYDPAARQLTVAWDSRIVKAGAKISENSCCYIFGVCYIFCMETEYVAVRIDIRAHSYAKSLAARQHKSLQDFVRDAIFDYASRQETSLALKEAIQGQSENPN